MKEELMEFTEDKLTKLADLFAERL
jgi:hypothetical protein